MTTSSTGAFSLTGEYSCTAGTEVYLYSIGGNPGTGSVNPSAGLMAILGQCPSSGTFAGVIPFVSMNEVSTVASAYAMAGFAVDAQHVGSSGSFPASLGIANAFANAANLYPIGGGGSALALTPAGNGSVPQRKINSLADSLAACVNSTAYTSQASNPCYELFNSVTNSQGLKATDTATFAIYLAQEPATDNPSTGVTTIFNQAVTMPPFAPTLYSHPTDWALAVTYSGGGLTNPSQLAADESGNIWVTNPSANSISKLSPQGVALSPAAGFTTGLTSPIGIAIDVNANIWMANSGSHSVAKFAEDGTAASGSPFSPTVSTTGPHNGIMISNVFSTPQYLSIDSEGEVWVSDAGNQLVVLGSDGSFLASSTDSINGPTQLASDPNTGTWVPNTGDNDLIVYGLLSSGTNYGVAKGTEVDDTSPSSFSNPQGIAIDNQGSKWVTENSSSVITRVDGGQIITDFSGGGLSGPTGVAIDGLGKVWIANTTGSTLSEFAANGTALTPASGYVASNLSSPNGLAVDASGNVWLANSGANTVTMFIGAATPVVSPLALGNANNTLGTQP